MFVRVVRCITVAAFAGACLAEQMLTPSNGLQALDAVERTLHKMLGANTNKALLKIAAPVVELVDKTVQEVESGNLTKKASSEKVLFAIKAMQGLQDQLQKGSKVDKMDTLQKELAAKKAELAQEEGFKKKLDEMKEKLAEKKQQLEVITKEKEAAASQQKDQQENSQEVSMVTGLVKMARDLAATRVKSAPGNVSKADVVKNVSAATATTGVPKPLQAILMNLQGQAHNVSADLKRIDAEEKIREDKLVKLAATHVPVAAKTDAIDKGKAMIEQLAKQEQRSYKKNRALKQTQLNELNDGIRAVERGDVAALRSLMSKMQTEVKTLGSEGKGFLA